MSYVTRDELRGLTPLGLVVLFVNRANDLGIKENQIKIDKAIRGVDGNVSVTVSPTDITGWVNGPIEVIIPPVDVVAVYGGEVRINYEAIGEKPLTEVLAEADFPPCPPASIEVDWFNILAEGPHLDIAYRFKYTNAFFIGELVVEVDNAPNNLDSLRILNNLFIGN